MHEGQGVFKPYGGLAMTDHLRHDSSQNGRPGSGLSLPGLMSRSRTESMGDFHLSSENFSLALEYYGKVDRDGEAGDSWRLGFKMGECYRRKGLYNEARECYLLAEGNLAHLADSLEYGILLDRIGSVLLNTGEPEEALRTCFRAYEILKNSSLHSEVAEILNRIAISYMRLGYPEEAGEFFADALSSFRRVDHSYGVACCTMNLGLLKKNACRFSEALDLNLKALRIARNHSFGKLRMKLTLHIGIIYYKQHRDGEATRMFLRARRLASAAGDQELLIQATHSLGRAVARLGRLARAERFLLEGRVLAEKNGQRRSLALADEFLGELAELRGDLPAAESNYLACLRAAEEISPAGDVVVEALTRLARVKVKQGLPLEANRHAERALQLAERNGEIYEVGYLHTVQAHAWQRLGRRDRAENAWQNAVHSFKATENATAALDCAIEFASFLYDEPTLQGVLRAKTILQEARIRGSEENPGNQAFRAALLLARIEAWLGNLDLALLGILEAEEWADASLTGTDLRRLAEARAEVEKRKILQSGDSLGFLPGRNLLNTGSVDGDFLRPGIESAWQALHEHCQAAAACLCIGQSDSFNIGMPIREVEMVGSGQEPPGHDPDLTLIEPLDLGRKRLGWIYLRRQSLPFSSDLRRYVSGFARMLGCLFADQDQGVADTHPDPERQRLASRYSIITRDPAVLDLLDLAGRLAETNASVLLAGETGTGKGLFAHAIHLMSGRRDKPFVHVNCAAMPEELLESELFGHVKGAFTGAVQDKPGLIESAAGGTLFLDEVGKTSLAMQAKLLLFLDNREIRRVGANSTRPVDVRLLTATKTDLRDMATTGRFLEDLYFRLNDFPLSIPPLRRRPDDILLLAEHFLGLYGPEFGKEIRQFSAEARSALLSYPWPGNIRELEKVVRRALLLARPGEPVSVAALHLNPEAPLTPGREQTLNLSERLEAVEKEVIAAALAQSEGKRKRACEILGISYPTLLKKIRAYGLGD